ncbi:MAG: sigma-70 family RNA polymerase sigma factor [Candidatus Hydrogenedentes bacterium]|nr:sigma-70 family RNA polymerase sigma factor [Candidatus Hydrogenedentota bacterium]
MFVFKRLQDKHLVQQVLAGRPESFEPLVHKYLPLAFAGAYARIRHHADAEDVAQEALLKAYQSLSVLRDPAKFGPWLMGIVKNLCSHRLRDARRESEALAKNPISDASAPGLVEKREMEDLLWKHLEKLDDSYREVLMMHYFAGKSAKEIAEYLDISHDAVRKRLERGRDALGESLIKALGESSHPEQLITRRAPVIMAAVLATPLAKKAAAASSFERIRRLNSIFRTKSFSTVSFATLGVLGILGGVAVYMNTRPTPTPPTVSTNEKPTTPPTAASAPPASVNSELEPAPKILEAAAALPETSQEVAEEEPVPGQRKRQVLERREDRGFGSIYGIVVYPDGTPAPGAWVGLIRGKKGGSYHPRQHSAYEQLPPRSVWKQAHADVQGRFSFTNLPLVDYLFLARAEGGVVGRSMDSKNLSHGVRMDKPVVLELEPGAPLAGTVLDMEGKPVPRAVVYPIYDYLRTGRTISTVWSRGLAVISDREGRFRFESVAIPRWRFLVTAPGYAANLTDYHDAGDESVRVVLSRGGSVKGRALLEGKPVSGLRLELVPPNEANGRIMPVALTDDSGEFTFTGLRSGPWSVHVDDAELVMKEKDRVLQVGENDNQTNIAIDVAIGGQITGKVLNANSRQPLSGAQVAAKGDEDWILYGEPTDEYGVFTIAGVPEGAYTLEPTKQGYVLADELRVNAGPGKPTPEAVLAMKPLTTAAPITGFVRDSNGQPVSGAGVSCDDRDQTVAVTFSGDGGQFEFSALPDDTELFFGARVGDVLTTRRAGPYRVKDLQGQSIVLTVETAASVEGRLTDASGAPLLTNKKKALITALPVSSRDLAKGAALTGNEGWYRLTGLSAGVYDLYAQAQFDSDGFPPRTRMAQIELAPGQKLTGLDLHYGSTPEGLTISGYVLTTEFQPVADAHVFADGYSTRREAMSAPDGSYTVHGLCEGTWHVWVTSPEHGAGGVQAEAGSDRVDLVLAGLGEVEGQVIDGATGRPITQFEIVAAGTYYSMQNVNDPEGRFLIKHVPCDPAQILARAKGYAFTTATVPGLKPGGRVSNVAIRLYRGGEIAGTVTLDGKPLENTLVYVQGVDGALLGRDALTDRNGGFHLENVTVGEARVAARYADTENGLTRTVTQPIVVQPDKTTAVNLDFTIDYDAGLEGTVRMDGRPVKAHIEVASDAGETFTLTSDEAGNYRFTQLPTGPLTLNVQIIQPPQAIPPRQFDITTTSNEVTNLDLELTGSG